MRSRETAASNIKTVMLSHVRLLLGSSHDSAPTKDILKIKCEFLEEKLIDALLANDALKDINDSLREEIDAPTPWHSVVYHQSASSQTDSKIFPHLDTATQTCGNPTPATSIAFTQTTKPKTKRRLCQTDSINCSSDFSSQANLSVPVASCATQCEQAPAAPLLGAQQPSTPPTSGPPVPQSDVIFGQKKKLRANFYLNSDPNSLSNDTSAKGLGTNPSRAKTLPSASSVALATKLKFALNLLNFLHPVPTVHKDIRPTMQNAHPSEPISPP